MQLRKESLKNQGASHLFLHSAVQIYEFHIFMLSFSNSVTTQLYKIERFICLKNTNLIGKDETAKDETGDWPSKFLFFNCPMF